MGLFDWFKKTDSNIISVSKSEYEEAKKGLETLQTVANYSRPSDMSGLTPNMSLQTFSNLVSPIDLYQMSRYSDILRNVIPTIRNEIFRNGFDIIGEDSELSKDQKKKVEKTIKRANHNEQTLKEVLMEFEDDLQIYDNAYLLIVKSYNVNERKDIVGGNIDEIVRCDPLNCEKVLDKSARLGYDLTSKPVYVSMKNRKELLYTPRDKEGYQCLRACYKVKVDDKDGSYNYYDANEILHTSKYNPSKTYGFSQLYSLYNKVMTLINQDYYIKQYYSGSKVPKGILTVNTTNAEGFLAMWNKFLEKVRMNPHQINPVINQTNDTSKEAFKFISFMNNLQEMQYTEVRNEMRQQIGALFNVSPIFQNDVSTSGGLNNEGLQITVTNRGVELGQSIYNEKVLPFIFDTNMGITDYTIKLKPSDEIDEAAEKDLRLKDLQIAKATAELGIEVTMNLEGKFSYAAGVVKLQQQAQNNLLDEGMLDPMVDEQDTPENPVEESKPEPKIEVAEKSISKAAQLPAKEKKIFQSELEKELDSIVSKLDFTKKPSEEELNNIIKQVTKNLNKRLNAKSAVFIKAIYDKSKTLVEKEVKRQFPIDDRDRNVIEALKRDPTYRKAFEGVSGNMSKRLTDIVKEAYNKPKEFTINNIVDSMKQELNKSTDELRTIARTETSKVSIAARKTQYDKTGFVYKYKWIGPDDDRTGQDSKAIKNATKDGVTWNELVETIQKNSSEGWVVDPIAPIPRPNTRHTFIAVRVE